jgi:xylose isomerase
MDAACKGVETGAKLVQDQPRVHRLINARNPRWLAPLGVMIVEGINHLTHLLKAIKEEQGRFLVGVPEWVHYLVKATP